MCIVNYTIYKFYFTLLKVILQNICKRHCVCQGWNPLCWGTFTFPGSRGTCWPIWRLSLLTFWDPFFTLQAPEPTGSQLLQSYTAAPVNQPSQDSSAQPSPEEQCNLWAEELLSVSRRKQTGQPSDREHMKRSNNMKMLAYCPETRPVSREHVSLVIQGTRGCIDQ